MAAGLPTWKVEIEFTTSVWTDVTSKVVGKSGVVTSYGRSDEFGDVQPATLSATLENFADPTTGFCPFTPDSPASPYYPNVVEGKRVRYTVTYSAVPYQLFIGWITQWKPQVGVDYGVGYVTITASDALAIAARRTLQSGFIEDVQYKALSTSGTWSAWPLDDDANATTVRNAASSTGGQIGQILNPTGAGSHQLATNPPGLLTDGMFTATSDGSASFNGPFLQVNTASGQKTFTFWFRTKSAHDGVVAEFHKVDGSILYYFKMVSGVLKWYDGASTLLGNIFNGRLVNDGAWHSVWLQWDSGTGTAQAGDAFTGQTLPLGSYSATLLDIRNVTWAAFGARSSGDQCFDGDISGISCNTSTLVGYEDQGFPLIPSRNIDLFTEFARMYNFNTTANAAINGTDVRTVLRNKVTGRNLLDVMNQLARTTASTVWVRPSDGKFEFRTTDQARPTTPIVTITLGADDDATGGQEWRRGIETHPTRVTVTSPIGSVTVVDTVAEAAGIPRRDVTIDTYAGSTQNATDIGNQVLTQSSRLRLSKFSVDLVTATNALYAAILGNIFPGARLRLGSTPQSFLATSYVDVYVIGWTITCTVDAFRIDFITAPCDTPPEARWDDATYGRWASDGDMTLNTTVTSAGTTIIVTTAGTRTFTTLAGSYPLDIDLNGERITLNSAPGGAVSPQTFTGVTRGVAPTVARAHVIGEAVEVFDAARWSL